MPRTQRDTITERAAARITSGYSSSRISAVCCFESFRRVSARRSESVSRSRSNSTAAATSGPASEPAARLVGARHVAAADLTVEGEEPASRPRPALRPACLACASAKG